MKVIKVAVFYSSDPGLRVHWSAYTRDYNSSCSECCMHEVTALGGKQAKKLVIEECKLHRQEYLNR